MLLKYFWTINNNSISRIPGSIEVEMLLVEFSKRVNASLFEGAHSDECRKQSDCSLKLSFVEAYGTIAIFMS